MNQRTALFFFYLFVTGFFVCCRKEYSEEKASGTLLDSLGNCSEVFIQGTYYDDKIPVHDSNYVTIQVDVIKAGAYSIKTDLQNGFMFADSGYFYGTGFQTIRLNITGRPLSDTITGFTVTFGNSNCSFSVLVKNSVKENIPPVSGLEINTWEFTDSTNNTYHKGVVIPNPPGINIHANGECLYGMMGAANPSFPYDTVLYIVINFPPPFIQAGTYNTAEHSYFAYTNYTGHESYYVSNQYTGGKLIYNITSFDDRARYIKGEFSGPAIDINGNEVFITRGRFYANVFY